MLYSIVIKKEVVKVFKLNIKFISFIMVKCFFLYNCVINVWFRVNMVELIILMSIVIINIYCYWCNWEMVNSNNVLMLSNVVKSGIWLKWFMYFLFIIVFNIILILKREKKVLLISLDMCKFLVIFGNNIFYKMNNIFSKKKLEKIIIVMGWWFIWFFWGLVFKINLMLCVWDVCYCR